MSLGSVRYLLRQRGDPSTWKGEMKHISFTCDWHNRNLDAGENPVYEDEAYERGWVTADRHKKYATVLPGFGSVPEVTLPEMLHHDERHVCQECAKDPGCRAWLVSEGFKIIHSESQKNFDTAAP